MKQRMPDGKYPHAIQEKVSSAASTRDSGPIKLSEGDMRTLGHMVESRGSTRWRYGSDAIRAMCVDCMGGGGPLDAKGEIERCTSVGCPLWPFRFGTKPETSIKRLVE